MSDQDDRRGEPTWSDPWYPPTAPPSAQPPPTPPPVAPPPHGPPQGAAPPPAWPPGPHGGPNPPPYPGAPHYDYPPARRTNSNALVALIVGIVSLTICQPVGLVAFFLGRSARREIAASHGAEEGDGMALAGQIIGMISFAIFVLSILLAAVIILVAFVGAAASSGGEGGLSA